jgi:2-iminobutanoate/2-iminopropanoate deaminase
VSPRSVEVAGLGHGEMPIPVAALRNGLLVSGGVSGTDPESGTIPENLDAEVAQVFANIKSVLEAAGMKQDHVVKLTFFVRDRSARGAINVEWVALFPDPVDRPARHTLVQDLPGVMRVQAEIIAFSG